eukprot:8632085-Alexandrium_andersonii.AAC.1
MCIRDSPRPPEKRLRRARRPPFIVTIGFSVQNDAETPGREVLGWHLRSFSGPRSSSFERLKRANGK